MAARKAKHPDTNGGKQGATMEDIKLQQGFVADANDQLVLKVLNPDLCVRMLAGTQKQFTEIDCLPFITQHWGRYLTDGF
jgi:hypothetical protein